MNIAKLADQTRLHHRWITLLAGLLTVGGLLGYLLWSEHRLAMAAAETTGRNLSETIEARLDASLRRTDAVLQALIRELPDDAMQRQQAARYQSKLDAELDARSAHFPELTGLRVFDATGSLLYTNGRAHFKGTAHVDDREFFVQLKQDPHLPRTYSKVFSVRSTGTTSFAVAYPIRSKQGEFLGVTLALINLDYFKHMLERLDIGPNGIIAIRRSDDFSLVLRQPSLENEINKTLAVGNPTREAILSGKKEASVRFSSQSDKVWRTFSVRVLDHHPFYVLVALADDDVLRNWRGRARLIGIASLLLLGLMAMIQWHLFRSERQVAAILPTLTANERRFRSLFHEAPVGHILNRLEDGQFVEINIAFAEMTGYGRHELEKLSYLDITPSKYRSAESEQLAALRAHGHYGPYEKEYIRKDGSLVDVRLNGVLYEGEDGEKLILSVVEDISDRRHAETQLRLMASIFEHSGEAILITDHDNRIVTVNQAFTRLTGYENDDVIGKDPRILSSGRNTHEEYVGMWTALHSIGLWHGEIWDRRKDGSTYPKWLTISTLKNAAGEITHYIASFTDISERKAAEEQIRHLAHHDTLTGLPNRFHLQGRLEQALATARRDNGHVAVLFLDMDRFKIINDTLGHHVGDLLLIEVGHRLRDSVRESDVVARLGGDEFVVVLADVEVTAAHQVADKILRNLGLTYRIGEHDLRSTPSLGIALFPEDGDSVDALMKNADTAMYHAKTAGRNNVQFFAAHMNAHASERMALENSLRLAVENDEFELHYQPQIEVISGRVVGVEALVRWRHPEQGLISPLKFIPIAEETGLIVPLGEWVLWEAVRQLAAWRAIGLDSLRMAVNLSAHQLRSPTLATMVGDVLAEAGIDPIHLELEITESVAMDDPQATIELLGRLRQMGIDLAIDDFGTGYSSLSYLKLLPIQWLKLDRSFVMDIEHDPNDAAICTATIALAHSLGLGVIAEGVETEAQRDYLARLGCDVLQGYLYSRPLPAAEAEAYLFGMAAKA